MVVNVGINGFGRVGRVVFRTCLNHPDVKIAAINDPAIDVEYICYLMKYDSTHGKLKCKIIRDGNKIIIDDCNIQVFLEKAPQNVPWHTADVHYIIEASGMFTSMEKASGHLMHKGVKRVIVTAPSIDVPMLILGVNEADIRADMKIVSCGSSTLYCLAPIAKVLEDNYGIKEGFITSIHAMTPSLKPLDGLCLKGKHWRDHRSITQNIIPATIGACKALGRVIPSLQNRTCGLAFRVPITNVSVLDFTVRLQCSTSLADIAASVQQFAKVTKQTIIKINTDDVVSSDFIGDRYSCILDVGSSMQLNSDSFKLICWYENEYSYACRVIDLINFSEAQFKQQLDIKNRLNFLSSQSMRETGPQKQVKSPFPRYSTKLPVLIQQPPKFHTANYLERLSTSINLENKSARRTTNAYNLWNDTTNAVRPQNTTVLQSFSKAVPQPVSNTTQYLSRQNTPGSISMGLNSPYLTSTSTTSCFRAREHLELVKKEFSKMVNMTETLLKQSCPDSSVNIDDSKSKKVVTKKENTSGCIEINENNSNTVVNLNEIIGCKTAKNAYFPRPREKDNDPNKMILNNGEVNLGWTEPSTADIGTQDTTSKAILTTSDTVVKPEEELMFKFYEHTKATEDQQNEKPETIKYDATPCINNDSYKEVTCLRFQPIEHSMTYVPKDVERIKKDSNSITKNYGDCTLDHQIESDRLEKVVEIIHTDENFDLDDKAANSTTQISDYNTLETEQNYHSKVEIEKNDNDKYDNGDSDDIKAEQSSSIPEDDQQSVFNSSDIKDDECAVGKKYSIETLESGIVCGASMSSSRQKRKQDIYDKLDSISNSSSCNSLRADKKKSQIIAITDLTSSLEDLERLDKICRIMEISDELSDVLFSTLNEKPGEDCDKLRSKWSFKELCEKVKLDEFCKKVFGK